MSHLHIPDGVLPVWLWASAWLATLGLVWFSARTADATRQRRRVPMLAVVSAVMLVAMSSEIVPIAYHVNLTVAGGALLGPALSPIAAFIVVVVLALLGHGGITVIGLNTLVIAAEMVIGWALVRVFVRAFGRDHVRTASALATVITLATTTTLLVGIVAVGGSAATGRETGALDPTTLKFESPFGQGLFEQGLFSGGEGESAPEEGGELSVERFAATVYILGPAGWVLEALVTALVLGYIARVRPDLLFGGMRRERVLPGDEAVH